MQPAKKKEAFGKLHMNEDAHTSLTRAHMPKMFFFSFILKKAQEVYPSSSETADAWWGTYVVSIH